MNSNIDPLEQVKAIINQVFPNDKTLDNNAINVITSFVKGKKLVWQADEKSNKLSFEFLTEAERDIKSCKILYSKKIYSHAAYHFQQAVEKAMKGYS